MGLENPPDSSYELHEYWPALAPDRQPYLVEQVLRRTAASFHLLSNRHLPCHTRHTHRPDQPNLTAPSISFSIWSAASLR